MAKSHIRLCGAVESSLVLNCVETHLYEMNRRSEHAARGCCMARTMNVPVAWITYAKKMHSDREGYCAFNDRLLKTNAGSVFDADARR